MDKKIFLSLMKASAAHGMRSREFFQKLDLSEGQPKVLYILLARDGLSQKDLAYACRVKDPTMTVLLKKMEKQGLIQKEPGYASGGKRTNLIYLTRKGKHIAQKVYDDMEELERVCIQGFSEAQILQLFAMLEQLTENLLSFDTEDAKWAPELGSAQQDHETP